MFKSSTFIGIGINIIWFIIQIVVKEMPLPLIILGFIIGTTFIILGIIFWVKSRKNLKIPASSLRDIEMGEHAQKVELSLILLRKEILKLKKSKGLKLPEFNYNKDRYFELMTQHYKEIGDLYTNFMVTIGLYIYQFKEWEQLKKDHKDTNEVKQNIKSERLKLTKYLNTFIKEIDRSIANKENITKTCYVCQKKQLD